MNRQLLDRWTDTTAFRVMLFVASLVVLPVLAIGVFTTVIGGAVAAWSDQALVDDMLVVIAVLSIGGALGFVGYLRARAGTRAPGRHNVTATFVCVAAGVLTAFGLGGFSAAWAVRAWLAPWDGSVWASLFALFALANVAWAISGIACSSRSRLQ
jgi:hypothetical protein